MREQRRLPGNRPGIYEKLIEVILCIFGIFNPADAMCPTARRSDCERLARRETLAHFKRRRTLPVLQGRLSSARVAGIKAVGRPI